MPQNRLRNPAQWGRPYTFSTPLPGSPIIEAPATEEDTDESPSPETVIAHEVKEEHHPEEARTPSSAPWTLVEAPPQPAIVARLATKATPRGQIRTIYSQGSDGPSTPSALKSATHASLPAPKT